MSETTVDLPQHVFTLFAVFRLSSSHPVVLDGRDVPGIVQELEDVVDVIGDEGVTVRGWYDVSGLRSDADLMVWLRGGAGEDLQWALRELRRSSLLKPLIRTWGAVGVLDGSEAPDEEEPALWLAVRAPDAPLETPSTLEADDLSGLARLLADHRLEGRHAAGVDAEVYVGRLIEPVEIIEVLQ